MKNKNFIIDEHGIKRWLDENGNPHRIDGPAVIYSDGRGYWYKHGLRHNENGPALINNNGDMGWYKNGLLHNENGPAIVWSDGSKSWYINDIKFTEEEFKQYKIKNFIIG